jgi:hypothetical protein
VRFRPASAGGTSSTRSATREISASSRVVTRVISRVRKPDVRMRYRTSRSASGSGREAQVSRVSHEGQVFGCNHATSWSSTPSAVSQRERGTPLTAGVRRTRGVTNGWPAVTSTIWRAPTRRTACTPAWTRRARGAEEHKPRSATSPSPACVLGWTACTWARPWVRRGGRPA